ncbi:hypothetical protein Ait01nite_082290 [Actinoplanes italicus]|uniref:Uncharacterized protein n=1 Tax=Actinoplanes italicus TaxID=113567 RepID=A0A2T0K336_9ACTN|nr:hypothetical protein [Actinoplanes italicus]PRX17258.1 hypothetical protein CLV67_11634 [Actinoplanes italicus]GIE35184.1 hypothetical protein Ait01nite_082290 [Actinoplanes italicus]
MLRSAEPRTRRPRGEIPPQTPAGAASGQDSVLTGLAEAAVRMIESRLARHEPARTVVAEVLSALFNTDPGQSYDPAGRACDDRLDRVLRDAGERDRVVAAVLEIVRRG